MFLAGGPEFSWVHFFAKLVPVTALLLWLAPPKGRYGALIFAGLLLSLAGDAFLALPGGYGTADEFFEILSWAQLGIHHKPIVLLNVAGFFNPLVAWLDHCVHEGFLPPHHRALLAIAADAEEVLVRLCRQKEPHV